MNLQNRGETRDMIYAKSGNTDFIQRITRSKLNGFIHSTFKHTLNIQCLEDGELYTIACKEIDNGPNTLIVDAASIKEWNVQVNDKVCTGNNHISLGNKLTITIERANCWEGILPTYPTDIFVLKKNVEQMKRHIETYGTGGGIKSKSFCESPFELEMSKMLHERTNLVLNGLLNKQIQRALKHAVSLIGLGPGLTPSGDDFLVGLFTTFHLNGSYLSQHKEFCKEIEKVAKTATNDISYMALKKASDGKVRESIITLIEVLLTGEKEELILSLNNVLNIGSSSGTDIALGILAGLEINFKNGGLLNDCSSNS